jgi:superkiller protein 3
MVWQHLGTTLDAEGKPDEAIVYLTRAIELNPNYAAAHNVLGYVLTKQKKLDEALVCFTRAAELDPKFIHAHHNRAYALKKLNRVDEAIPAYWQILELDPKYANASDLHTLFNLVRAQKDRDKTISFFTSVVQSQPKNAWAHWFLGNALWYQGRRAESLGPFQRGSELAPQESRHFFSLGNALAALNRLDEAIIAYEKAIELAPKDVHLRYEFGVAWNRKGLFPKALDCWKKTVEMDAKYLRGHTALAWHLATNPDRTLRNPQEAVVHAQAAVDLAPEDPNHWSNLGVALWQAGDFKAAIEKLEKADQMTNGGDHHHRFFLAMAYWQMGEKDKARQTYDAGVRWMDKNQPDNEELRRFRAEAEDLMTHQRTKSTKASETKEK